MKLMKKFAIEAFDIEFLIHFTVSTTIYVYIIYINIYKIFKIRINLGSIIFNVLLQIFAP